jgi:hypothetical protein
MSKKNGILRVADKKEQDPDQHPNHDPNPQVHGTDPRDLDLDPYKNGKDLEHCFNH